VGTGDEDVAAVFLQVELRPRQNRGRARIVREAAERNVVHPVVAAVRPVRRDGFALRGHVAGVGADFDAPEIADVRFLALEKAQIDRVILTREPGQFAEIVVLLEITQRGTVFRQVAGGNERIGEVDRGTRVLRARGFVVGEEMQDRRDDRPAEMDAVLPALEVRPGVGAVEKRLPEPFFRNVGGVGAAMEFIAARARHGVDDRRAGLLVLGLEVLRLDLEFLDRRLRERVALRE